MVKYQKPEIDPVFAPKDFHLSNKQLKTSFTISAGGINFRLNPLIRTASRTFSNLFR